MAWCTNVIPGIILLLFGNSSSTVGGMMAMAVVKTRMRLEVVVSVLVVMQMEGKENGHQH